MKKRRWALLGANLLLGMAILAQPGQATAAQGEQATLARDRAASVCYIQNCLCECVDEWTTCVLDALGQADVPGDCNVDFNRCLRERCYPF